MRTVLLCKAGSFVLLCGSICRADVSAGDKGPCFTPSLLTPEARKLLKRHTKFK